MEAVVFHEYGSPDVLRREDVEKPTPSDDEVLIRVRAASVNPYDWHFLRGWPYIARAVFGLWKPKLTTLGVDVAGQITAVGRNVTGFKPGDEVFGTCDGAFAEYACPRASAVVIKPGNVSFEQAASVPIAALTALQALRDLGHIQPGAKVLINGAAGGCGTFAVQIAKWFGAAVTGVCSATNVEMVRSIGADRVVDYTQEDFTMGSEQYDVMFDCIGNHSLSACRRVLQPKGIYIMVGGPSGRWLAPVPRLLKMLALSPFVSQKLLMVHSRRNGGDLVIIGELMESGKITPVIDKRFALREVPEAIRYVEKGHARGKVVITLGAS